MWSSRNFSIITTLTGLLLIAIATFTKPVSIQLGSPTNAVAKPLSEWVARLDHQTPLLDFTALVSSRRAPELADPLFSLPRAHLYSAEDLSILIDYAERCDSNAVRTKVWSKDLSKAYVWHRFTCGHLQALSPDFFQIPPYTHPLGQSFVALAVAGAVRPEYRDPAWVLRHREFTHV
ncbi:MAG: hypothetical protein AAB425_07455, partial [Bdellovibrionota bacterium]